jgi:hypothetical protein
MNRPLNEQPRDALVTLTPEETRAVSGGLLLAAGTTVTKAGCCLGCASYGRPGFAVLAADTGVA